MPAINRLPRGLLSILDGQTLGTNPKDLDPLVHAQLPILPLYLASKGWETVISSSANVTAAGVTSAILVPNGEFWYVRFMGFFYEPGDPTRYQEVTPYWRRTPIDQPTFVDSSSQFTTQASLAANVSGHYFSEPFTVSSGMTVGHYASMPSPATSLLTSNLSICRFQA
jgi:hypothetical protein